MENPAAPIQIEWGIGDGCRDRITAHQIECFVAQISNPGIYIGAFLDLCRRMEFGNGNGRGAAAHLMIWGMKGPAAPYRIALELAMGAGMESQPTKSSAFAARISTPGIYIC